MCVEFVRHRVPSSQRSVVLRYTGYRQTGGLPVRMREHPCTYVPLIIDFEQGWRVTHLGRGGAEGLGSFAAGLIDSPVEVEHPGLAGCVQVDLTPTGARRLFGIPLSELVNRSVPLEELLGRQTLALAERLGEASEWRVRFALVERMLETRLARTAPASADVRVALERITGPERAPIRTVARELGWSDRRLIERVRDASGLTPKRLQRVARLERLEEALRTSVGAELARLAPALGFTDQPHLAREVRALTGLTPSELHAEAGNFVHDGLLVEL